MRSCWLLLLLSLAACATVAPRRAALDSRPAAASIDQAAVGEDCDGGSYQPMRIADGRSTPIFFCN